MMQENKDNSMYRSNNDNHDDNDKVKYRLLRLLEHLLPSNGTFSIHFLHIFFLLQLNLTYIYMKRILHLISVKMSYSNWSRTIIYKQALQQAFFVWINDFFFVVTTTKCTDCSVNLHTCLHLAFPICNLFQLSDKPDAPRSTIPCAFPL